MLSKKQRRAKLGTEFVLLPFVTKFLKKKKLNLKYLNNESLYGFFFSYFWSFYYEKLTKMTYFMNNSNR